MVKGVLRLRHYFLTVVISTSIYPPEYSKTGISKHFFQRHFRLCRNAIGKCKKKKKREINKTPVTLEAHFNMPDYISAIQFLYFFKQLRALDDTSSLEQAQRNDKKN